MSETKSQPMWEKARPRRRADRLITGAVGGVGVAGVVAVHVMAPVGGDPTGQRALDGHRPHHCQDEPENSVGREAVVGEQPVEPDGEAEAGDDIERESSTTSVRLTA